MRKKTQRSWPEKILSPTGGWNVAKALAIITIGIFARLGFITHMKSDKSYCYFDSPRSFILKSGKERIDLRNPEIVTTEVTGGEAKVYLRNGDVRKYKIVGECSTGEIFNRKSLK